MEPRCKCGSESTSTAVGYKDTYSLNGKIIYATCQCGKVVIDKSLGRPGPIRFDECETPIYRIVR